MSLFEDSLGQLMKLSGGRNRRISSNEQPNWNDGNFDMTRFKPGETFEMPELRGPGVINHIWLTSHAGGVGELDAVTLRIYWDGREEPGVEVPLGSFFAVGQRPAVVESYPVQVSPTGSLSCYWRMPFAKSARIVVTNDNHDRSTGLYWQVDWMEFPELPAETPYFHARYRQEYPAVMGQDYLIADLKGRGHYVGTVMSITMAQDGWFGEGDDFFYIDGEEIPSLQGTGSEDYFNDAWGFRSRSSIWFGQPHWQGWSGGDSGVCYRWHVLDPVRFETSLKVTMEHKGNRDIPEEAWYIERPDFFSSIAYWYQLDEPAPGEALPGWPERCVPWQNHPLARAFRSAEVSGSAELTLQTLGFFGGRPVLFWPNRESGASLTIPFPAQEAGRYAVRLSAFTAPEYGVFDIELDGKTVQRAASFYSKELDEVDLLLGIHELEAGEHHLVFRAVDTAVGQPSDANRHLGLELLRILPLPPEAFREVKTDNEAHFIRLGIGRALYAYRLAFDVLPDSLETLVEMGLMEERYLKDENEHPLEWQLEDSGMTVWSTADGGWRHTWVGLDARR